MLWSKNRTTQGTKCVLTISNGQNIQTTSINKFKVHTCMICYEVSNLVATIVNSPETLANNG
jgi:hypothetical protein